MTATKTPCNVTRSYFATECVVLSEAEPNEAEVVAGGLVHTDDEGQEFVVPPFEYEAEPSEFRHYRLPRLR